MHRPTLKFHLVSHLTTATCIWCFKILLVLPLHPAPGPYPFAAAGAGLAQPQSPYAPLLACLHLPHLKLPTQTTLVSCRSSDSPDLAADCCSALPLQSLTASRYFLLFWKFSCSSWIFCFLIAQTFLHLSCAGSNTWPASPNPIQCTSSFFAKSFLEVSFPSNNGDIYSIVFVQSLSYFYN